MNSPVVSIRIENGDALQFSADVLVLKHAQSLHGVDKAAFLELQSAGFEPDLPRPGSLELVQTQGNLGAKQILFVGVNSLYQFGYSQIRSFGHRAIASLTLNEHPIRRAAFVIHGPGYGLDEIEAFESLLAGIVEAISEENFPASLSEVVFIERNRFRANRLSAALHRLIPDGIVVVSRRELWSKIPTESREILRAAGYASDSKRHVFVAMPFADSMSDVFHFGIQGVIHRAGMLAERADLAAFTGDVMTWVRDRISTAHLMVADLTDHNPNVYLEIGYAWGKNIPTLLLSREGCDPQFDVYGQRRIIYSSIRDLESKLTDTLRNLSTT